MVQEIPRSNDEKGIARPKDQDDYEWVGHDASLIDTMPRLLDLWPDIFFFLIHYWRTGLTYGEAMGRALKA